MRHDFFEVYKSGLVSIIIPVYNCENLIEYCLKSIAAQSYRNIEVILVDDGSTDNSYKICQEIIGEDCRFRLFHKENGGVSSARNYGLKNINGDYVTFVDSDDIVNIMFIESLVKNIVEHTAGICISAFYKINIPENFKVAREMSLEIKGKEVFNSSLFSAAETIENMIFSDDFKWEVCGKLFRKDLINNLFFDESEILFEDFTFTCKALTNVSKVVFVPLQMYYYVNNPFSASKQLYSDKLKHLIATTDNFSLYIEKFFPDLEYCAKYFKAIIYFDILDKIIISSSSLLDCVSACVTNRYGAKFYFKKLVDIRFDIFKVNIVSARRIKIKYLFTLNMLFYYFLRYIFYICKK